MAYATIEPDFKIEIPEEIRDALRIKPGETIKVSSSSEGIILEPVVDVKSLRGFLKGIDTRIDRDEDRV
ncbi:MAG: AbrB family transcriptional regulator [Planctomycetes bacterium]|nr:AbrB family transcriptional regulator [Planctomycetota bacterium]